MGRRAAPPDGRIRDADRSCRRIFDAAVVEFAAKGYAGARVDEIAERAGVNRQLISYYYGGKKGLYQALLEKDHVDPVGPGEDFDSVPMPELIGRYCERNADNPEWSRLQAWDGLGNRPVDADDQHRTEQYCAQVERTERRHASGELSSDVDADMALFIFHALTKAPLVYPQVAEMITGQSPSSPEFRERYRRHVERFVAGITTTNEA